MDLSSYRRIVVLTGAGISHAAGLPTYRGPGGLWTDDNLAVLSDASALTSRRAEVVALFWSFRRAIASVAPTAAHRALAAFEERLAPGAELLIVTQNIDSLHQLAGSRRVCEYHGSLAHWRCDGCGTELAPPDAEAPPVHCGEPMRPAVVLFGEMIPVAAERTTKHALRDCDLFVAIGTSGTVAPASSFVRWAELNGAPRVLLNLEIFDGARELFTECHAGPADELVPRFFA
ncbi:MAG: NAD-dependent deacylase [Deltaproteobacteria bacterium]|nr:NAD-dependent deacylase [Deltaproteobacteria bacterium]MDQ3301295.1 NAD-dependent deacylase [Myxococcota bacterium]